MRPAEAAAIVLCLLLVAYFVLHGKTEPHLGRFEVSGLRYKPDGELTAYLELPAPQAAGRTANLSVQQAREIVPRALTTVTYRVVRAESPNILVLRVTPPAAAPKVGVWSPPGSLGHEGVAASLTVR